MPRMTAEEKAAIKAKQAALQAEAEKALAANPVSVESDDFLETLAETLPDPERAGRTPQSVLTDKGIAKYGTDADFFKALSAAIAKTNKRANVMFAGVKALGIVREDVSDNTLYVGLRNVA